MKIKSINLETVCGVSSRLPNNSLPEFAFAGKSNVGKSSLINAFMNRKSYARISSQPGKTQTINYYNINSEFYLVDLPGYGYAKVSMAEKQRWAKLMEQYFAEDGLITLGVLIVDARHKPTDNDVTMANWFKASGCRFAVVANKLDKLKKSEIVPNLERIRRTLELPEDVELIPFSAEKGDGREALVAQILSVCP